MQFRAYALCLIVAPILSAAAQAPELKWGPAPAIFPAGAKMAVLQGDPGKPGLFTVRLDMPDGYRIPPHWHPTDEHITVISGNFVLGGDKAAAKMTGSMAPNSMAHNSMASNSMGAKGGATATMTLSAGASSQLRQTSITPRPRRGIRSYRFTARGHFRSTTSTPPTIR